MEFLMELLKSFLTYIWLIVCAGIGVFAGISLRKKKNAKKEAQAKSESEK